LSLLTGEARYRRLAERILKLMNSSMMRAPSAFGHLLCALDLFLAAPFEIAIAGDRVARDTNELIDAVFQRYLPNRVVALADAASGSAAIKLLEGRARIGGKATAYVCRDFYCEAPVTDAAELVKQLEN
jgi:hypothetical protein